MTKPTFCFLHAAHAFTFLEISTDVKLWDCFSLVGETVWGSEAW